MAITMEELRRKARAYDEAVENMRKFRNALNNHEETDLWVSKKDIVTDIEYYFPELKESEDEKIRKLLIRLFTSNTNEKFDDVSTEEIIAWLENKGEPNTVVVIPKFREGDVIRHKGSTEELTIESISGECYHGKGWGLHISCDDDYELVKQKPSWNEDDDDLLVSIEDSLSDYLDYTREDRTLSKHCKDTTKFRVIGYIDWIKSIKGRIGG